MMDIKKFKKSKIKLLILFLIIFIVLLPLIYISISFIGRISPDSVIPDSFTAYINVPSPISMADNLFSHEPFSDIFLTQAFSPYFPMVEKIKENILEKKWVRFVAKRPLNGAIFPEGKFLVAWDIGIASSVIRFFPNIVGEPFTQAGKKYRFQYRAPDNSIIFIQPYKNLLIISNDITLFESVFDKTSRSAVAGGSNKKTFLSRNFDAGFLIASESFISWLVRPSPTTDAFLEHIKFAELVELALMFSPKKIDISVASSVASDTASIEKLILRDSKITALVEHLPGNTQYSTVFSIGTVEELLEASFAVYRQRMPMNLRRIDATARMFLGVSLNDLLFSWTAAEVAVLGLEARSAPVFVLQISDEEKRKDIFEKTFKSSVVENIFGLPDGVHIPQIELPSFLDMLLNIWGINISTPFYTVQNGFLFVSESPENIFSITNSIEKNDLLPKTELWNSLSNPGSEKSSLTLFYSLERIIPIFVKTSDAFRDALRLYTHGLLTLDIDDTIATVNLSAVPE